MYQGSLVHSIYSRFCPASSKIFDSKNWIYQIYPEFQYKCVVTYNIALKRTVTRPFLAREEGGRGNLGG